VFEYNKIVYLTVDDGRAKRLNKTLFGGQIAKFKRKGANKLSTTFFRTKKIILSFIYYMRTLFMTIIRARALPEKW